MTDILEPHPVAIASADLAGLDAVDLYVWGQLVESVAATMHDHADRHAAALLGEISGALRTEYDRRLAGAPAVAVAETSLGDAGVVISAAEAHRLMTIFDGLAAGGQAPDAAFLLGLAAAVERQVAHNATTEAGLRELLDGHA